MGTVTLTKQQILHLVRQAYLMGGSDYEEGCFYWCRQGSMERAEEILEEECIPECQELKLTTTNIPSKQTKTSVGSGK